MNYAVRYQQLVVIKVSDYFTTRSAPSAEYNRSVWSWRNAPMTQDRVKIAIAVKANLSGECSLATAKITETRNLRRKYMCAALMSILDGILNWPDAKQLKMPNYRKPHREKLQQRSAGLHTLGLSGSANLIGKTTKESSASLIKCKVDRRKRPRLVRHIVYNPRQLSFGILKQHVNIGLIVILWKYQIGTRPQQHISRLKWPLYCLPNVVIKGHT